MATVDKDGKYRRCGEVMKRHIAGETILVPVRGRLADMQRVYVLDGAAEFIWDRLDGDRTAAAIREEIVREFRTDGRTAAADCREFLKELAAADLILEAD